MRDIVTAVAALIAIALIALMVGPAVIDWDQQRGRVADLLRERLGIEARIAGPLQVSLLPTPELDASGIEFGPADAPVARAERLTVTLSPTALLSGRLTVTSARADNAEIIRPALLALAAGLSARPEAGAGLGQVGIDKLVLRGLRLIEGSGGARGAPHDVTIEAPSLAGPFRIDITDPGLGREFHAQIGRLEQGRARIKGLLEDRSLALRAGIDGIVALPGVPGRPLYDGLVTLNGNPSLGAGARAAQLPLQGSLRVIADARQAVADPVTLTIGDGERALQLAGRGEAAFAAARPRLALALATKRLDLTPPPADPPPRARPADLRAALLALAEGGGRPLPLDLDLDLEIGAVQVGGAVIHDLAAAFSSTGGAPVLHRLAARLPGSTALRFTRDAGATRPVEGELVVESGELGRLVAWLRGADLATGLPAEGRLAARLAGGAEGIAISALTLDSAAGALAGSGEFLPAAPGQRALPRLMLDLAARRFDARVLAALEPLKPVAGLEIATRLAVGSLVLDQAEVGGLRVALDRSGGTVSLNEFRLTGRAGEVLTLSGTAGPGATHLTAKLDAERLGDLARLAGAVLPRPEIAALQRRAGLLEPALAVANIRLTEEGGATAWDLAIDGRLGGTRISARTRSTNRAGDLAVEAEGEIAAADGARLLAQIGGGQPATPGAVSGPGVLRFKATGDPRREVAGSLGGEVAGLSFRFDGGYNPFRANPVEGRLSAETADLRRLLAAFGAGQRLPTDFAAEIHGRVFSEGAKVTLTRFEARLDEAPAGGEISLDLARGGQVAGQIRLGSVDLAALLAPATGTAPPASGAGLWPAALFGPPAPPPLAGDLWIEAETGRFGAATVEGPQFVYRFAPDLAAIEGFEARMGEARIGGTLTALRKERNVEIAGRITLARLPVSFLGGRLSGAIPFSGGGDSPRALIASLAGAGEVALDRFHVPEADPTALARVVARDLDALSPIDENRIGALVDQELRRAAFESPAGTWPASLVNGQLRLGGLPLPASVSGRPEIEITPAIGLDLVRGEVDSRLTFRQLALPKGWRGAVPEIALALSRRLDAEAPPRRTLQVGSLVNGLLAMAIQRDLERAEAFEADIRERAMHLRRQKGDAWRQRREREIREVEAMMADEARRQRLRAEAAAEFERQRLLRERLDREAREAREREAAERLARQRAEEERARLERLARDLAQPPATGTVPPPAASGAPLNLAPPVAGAPPG